MSEFSRMEQTMDQMRQSFGMPSMMPPSVMGAPGAMITQHGGAGAGRHQNHQQLTPFGGSMFGNMFGNMNAMMSQMQNSPNAHSFSSSSSRVVSYSSNGNGAPKYYEASSSTTQGPGGVRQTRKTERNSETGVDRMAIGHHIYDRGHVVERSRNRRTQEREENQEFVNMGEEDRAAFHEEWQRKSRSHHNIGSRDIGYHDQNNYRRPQQRAINSAEYHRNNIDRTQEHRQRERHSQGREEHRGPTAADARRGAAGGGSRHVQINSRPEEI